ncbi:MAG: pyridoxal-phosphate dependent enzyme [Bacteroidetes bacterium]|nr:MAG: pyridoxal-phosphate dependent enzyme [Bacteroidota bacterium]
MHLNFSEIRLTDVSQFFPNPLAYTINVLRLDEIHPIISGNKWFKLQGYLQQAQNLRSTALASYGGPYSNHLVAVAKAAELMGIPSIGFVRSYIPIQNNTLTHCQQMGMQIQWVHPANFRQVCRNPPPSEPCGTYYIPEGGYGPLGTLGFEALKNSIPARCTHIVTCVGTGTMLAGLAKQFSQVVFTGINASKGNTADITQQIQALEIPANTQIQVLDHHHDGGFGKCTPALLQFMNSFYTATNIPLDRVYTAKGMRALQTLVNTNYFEKGSHIVFIHSGGLQGNDSLPAGTLVY